VSAAAAGYGSGRGQRRGADARRIVTQSPSPGSQERLPGIDTTRAHTARVWNYWLGGKDNYPVDCEVGEQVFAVLPDIVDAARAQRGFLVRAVRYLAGEAGIRQFLDIGTGLPTAGNTHEVAQASAPECRIVYVDNDPLIMAHARALLTSTPEGATDYIYADLRDPDTILQKAARTLDFTRPIALMLLGIMEHILDTNEARAIVNRLLDALPSGSYLALCDPTTEVRPEMMRQAVRQWNNNATPPIAARSRQELIRFFDGLELLEPGVVSASLWRPETTTIGTPLEVFNFSGVGRKP
jgi:O-methyltransferase involved in polyketide biosynthesis